MDDPILVVIAIIILIIYMVIVGKIARNLDRSVLGWCVICFFLPTIGCLLLAYVGSMQVVEYRQRKRSDFLDENRQASSTQAVK